jgi:hypothetical protein
MFAGSCGRQVVVAVPVLVVALLAWLVSAV